MNSSANSLIKQVVAACFLVSAAICHSQTVEFTQNSVPPGMVESLTTHSSATVVTTVTAPASSSGYSFTHWEIDEGSGPYRADDAFGRAKNPVSFTILNPSTATAHYLPTAQDTDADGVPDWYEIHYFDTLTNNAASDGDGDGYSLLTEYQRGYNPLFANEMRDGLLSRSRSTETGYYLDPYFLYRRTSVPGGIYSYSAVITNGTTVTLPSLADLDGYRFIWWEVNGERQADVFGRSLSSTTVVATNGISVVSRHVPVLEDSDADGLPDWYEWQYFGHLTHSAVSDPDGDGYDIATEYARGYNPIFADEMRDGLLSRSRSVGVSYYGPPYCPYVINSDPPGIISTYGFVTSGTQVATSVAPSSYSGWRFTHWTIDGERKNDAFGVALDIVSGVVTTVTYFTAHYIPGTQDSDVDGIPDWYELYYFGDLDESASSDSDGDGYALATEYARGYSPVFQNSMVDGGLSRSRFTAKTVNLQLFERIEHTLVDSFYTSFFAIWPTNNVHNDYGDFTAMAVGDWDGDGDLDFFVGASNGVMTVYENIGSKYRINLSEVTAGFASLSGRWSDIMAPYPALGDWDGDGAADLAVGGSTGVIRLVSSTASFTGPHSPAADYEIDTQSSIAIPAIADLDGNGTNDLLVLLADGTVRRYENTGNPTAPFNELLYSNNVINLAVPNATGIGSADINHDGLCDVLISDVYGRIWEFVQTTNATFFLKSRVWAGTGPGFGSSLSICAVDVDGDSDIDAICGYAGGGVMYLRNPSIGIPNSLVAHSGADSILLKWDPNHHYKFRGYYVYRSNQLTGPFERISSSIVPTPEFTDNDVAHGSTYYYYVTALSGALYPGNTVEKLIESLPSKIVSAGGGSVVLWMPDYVQLPGKMAVLQLNVTHGTGISGNNMEIRVTYDPAMMKPASQIAPTNVTVEKTALTVGVFFTNNAATANGELIIQGTGGSVSGDGHLFDVNMFVASNAVAGAVSTNTFSSVTLYNTNAQLLLVDSADKALFTVLAPGGGFMLGDVDGDGDVDMDDHHHMMWLFRRNTRDAMAEEIRAGDINGDGEMDQKDIPLHLKLINGQKRNPE